MGCSPIVGYLAKGWANHVSRRRAVVGYPGPVLRKGVSIRQIAREMGMSPKTVRKMLDHPLPQLYRPRSRRYPKLGLHTGSIQRMLGQNATLPPSSRLSIKAIYERIRDTEGFRGSYSSVKDYARAIA